MLRFVARVLIARQHGWAGWWLAGSAGAEAPNKPVTKYLSGGATNPIHARYYCGGKPAQVRIRAHPPPAAPSFAASKTGSFGAGSTLQTHNATKRSMIARRRRFSARPSQIPSKVM